MRANSKDLGCAAIFALLGLVFGIETLRSLRLGTAVQMGPGYFPLILSGVMLVLAAVIALRSAFTAVTPTGRWPWRGLVLILTGPLLFAATVEGLGLAPSTFLICLVTAFASRKMRPGLAVLLAAVIASFCVLVFAWALALPVPVVGPWLSMTER